MPDDLHRRYADAATTAHREWVPSTLKNRSDRRTLGERIADAIAPVRDEEMAELRDRAETAEEALDSFRTALDRVIAFARSLADTDPEMADLIAETIANVAGQCKPGAALALLDPPEPRRLCSPLRRARPALCGAGRARRPSRIQRQSPEGTGRAAQRNAACCRSHAAGVRRFALGPAEKSRGRKTCSRGRREGLLGGRFLGDPSAGDQPLADLAPGPAGGAVDCGCWFRHGGFSWTCLAAGWGAFRYPCPAVFLPVADGTYRELGVEVFARTLDDLGVSDDVMPLGHVVSVLRVVTLSSHRWLSHD